MPAPADAATPAAAHADLFARIGPLPIQGAAWGRPARVIAWFTLGLLTFQILRTATRLPADAVSPTLAGTVLFCYIGLAWIVYAMQVSVTTIDAQGLRQRWITRRETSWDEIQYAKFVPMLMSKRLIIFRRSQRPLVFQGSTRELQTAFAHISLAYRRQ